MTVLRVGTRGSELALRQTRVVCASLGRARQSITFIEVVIRTHGDMAPEQPFGADWPPGGFIDAIEEALLSGRIDLAVHSHKDLPTSSPAGLIVAAVPKREAPGDVLVTRTPVDLASLSRGFTVGTSSPRRTAQIRRFTGARVAPIRGNVTTRLKKLDRGEVDGVVLARAGLRRLGIEPDAVVELPTDRFVPAPAQGALAVQTREGDGVVELLQTIEHEPTRRVIQAERSFLARVAGGCHSPVAALAETIDEEMLRLRGQLFSDDLDRMVEGDERGDNPTEVGVRLADRLLERLHLKT